MEEGYEPLSSGVDTAIAFTGSQQLWLPPQGQAGQSSRAEGVEDPQALPPTEELLEVHSFWGVEGHSFSRMWPLVGSPCSNGWSHIHVQMGSTSWTQWVIKREKRYQVEREMYWRGVGGENGRGMVVFYCIHA